MKKGNIYVMLEDSLDVVLVDDDNTHDQLVRMEQDVEYDIDVSDAFEDAADDIITDDSDETLLMDEPVSGEYSDDDIPIYSMTAADMEAGAYLDAYSDIMNGSTMSTGEMIDLISDM